jgi:hypothetical protein
MAVPSELIRPLTAEAHAEEVAASAVEVATMLLDPEAVVMAVMVVVVVDIVRLSLSLQCYILS